MALTVQQEKVLEFLDDNLKSISESTDKMRSRAITMLASSAALMSFVGAGEIVGGGNGIQAAFVAASLIVGAFVFAFSVGVCSPRTIFLPGCSSDPYRLRDKYLDVSENDLVLQILVDRSSCFNDAQEANTSAAIASTKIAWCVVAQAGFVAAAVMSRIF